MSSPPLKLVPLIVLVFYKRVAVEALPVKLPIKEGAVRG
jgi:hypothetical protein